MLNYLAPTTTGLWMHHAVQAGVERAIRHEPVHRHLGTSTAAPARVPACPQAPACPRSLAIEPAVGESGWGEPMSSEETGRSRVSRLQVARRTLRGVWLAGAKDIGDSWNEVWESATRSVRFVYVRAFCARHGRTCRCGLPGWSEKVAKYPITDRRRWRRRHGPRLSSARQVRRRPHAGSISGGQSALRDRSSTGLEHLGKGSGGDQRRSTWRSGSTACAIASRCR